MGRKNIRIQRKHSSRKRYLDGIKRPKEWISRSEKQEKREVVLVPVLTSRAKWIIFILLIAMIISGLAIGWAVSLITPDGEIRENSITTTISNSLLRTSDDKIKGIDIDIPKGYTKEAIEKNYFVKNGRTNIGEISAQNDIALSDAFDFDAHTLKSELQDKYILKSTIENEEIYIARNSITGKIELNKITTAYVDKSDYLTDSIYRTSGTGNDLIFTDVTNQYFEKEDFREGILYEASGVTVEERALTVTTDYWKKSNFVAEELYDFNKSGILQVANATVTDEWLAKSDFEDDKFYLSSGSGNNISFTDESSKYVNLDTFPRGDYVYVGISEDTTQLNVQGHIQELDDKLKKFNMSSVRKWENSYQVSDIDITISDVMSRFLPNYASIDTSDVIFMLNNPDKYKFRLWVGDRRPGMEEKVTYATNFVGVKTTSSLTLKLEPIPGVFEDTSSYELTLDFANKSNALGLLTMRLSSTLANGQTNAFGSIRGLEAYIVEPTPTTST